MIEWCGTDWWMGIRSRASRTGLSVRRLPTELRVRPAHLACDDVRAVQFLDFRDRRRLVVGAADEPGNDAAEQVVRQAAAAMRRGDEHDPADEWQRLEDQHVVEIRADRVRGRRRSGATRIAASQRCRPLSCTIIFREDSAHAVADEHHSVERGVALRRVERQRTRSHPVAQLRGGAWIG